MRLPRAGSAVRVVLSCEHARNRVPARYAPLFAGSGRLLASHRGWDPGALELARTLARRLRLPLAAAPASRLLADPNRSPSHPRLFSEATRALPRRERERLLDAVYRPHRDRVASRVGELAVGAQVVHLGVHTFTPCLAGVVRDADVGVLYDPRRPLERALALELRRRLVAAGSGRVRLNYPYRGGADGLTAALRLVYPPVRYLGLELEVNQKHALGPPSRWARARRTIAEAVAATLVSCGRGVTSPSTGRAASGRARRRAG